MIVSVLDAKHQAARRKFRTRATLIITSYAAAVGALGGFITAGFVLQPGDALPWAGVGALAAAALVSASLRFTLEPVTPEAPPTPAKAAPGWKVERVRTTRPGSRRAFFWQVTCPENPAEPSWDNDFGRGQRCGCRRFPSEGKALRYIERMEGMDQP